jgi:hypothetical protein
VVAVWSAFPPSFEQWVLDDDEDSEEEQDDVFDEEEDVMNAVTTLPSHIVR